jgi:hypothetical protein
MNSHQNKSFLLWLINPFVFAFFTIKDFRSSRTTNWFLISFFFGLSFVVSQSGADSGRYAADLSNMYKQQLSLSELLKSIYSEEGNRIDFYQPLVTWVFALFTENVKWLFTFHAIVFGYFCNASMNIISRKSMFFTPTKFLPIFMVLLLLQNPIWNINGVRMYIAIQIFFYGLLSAELEGKKKGFLFILFSMFVHFSLFTALLSFVSYKLLPVKSILLLFGFYVLAFLFGELNLEYFKSYIENLPGFLESRKGYLNEEYANGLSAMDNTAAWHYKLNQILSQYFILCVNIFVLVQIKKHRIDNKIILNHFKITLFLSALAVLAASVPSGSRFLVLTNMMSLTALVILIGEFKVEFPKVLHPIIYMTAYFLIIFQIRVGLDYVGILYFIGNPIVMLFFTDTYPVIDFIKTIFI